MFCYWFRFAKHVERLQKSTGTGYILQKSFCKNVLKFEYTYNLIFFFLATVQANLESSLAPLLTYKKWAFSSQEKIVGCAVGGPVPINTIDHLFTASLCGGFNAK